jgi:hypothetical protein
LLAGGFLKVKRSKGMGRWKGVLLCVVFLFSGCGSKVPHTVIPDYVKTKTRLVALLPVDNRTNDQAAAQMIREKLFEELYFKGYPKIPLKAMDEKLLKIYNGNLSKAGGKIPPKIIGELLGVDAVMYCILNESKTSAVFFHASTSVSVSCELRSAKTRAILWQAERSIIERNFGFSRHSLKIKASQAYEAVIQEIVDEVIKTLPDGPDLIG